MSKWIVPKKILQYRIQYYGRWATGARLDDPYVWAHNKGLWVPLPRALKDQVEYSIWYWPKESAEADALLLSTRWPDLMGRIEVAEIAICLV